MKISPKDYVVVQLENKKTAGVRVLSSGETLSVVSIVDPHLKKRTADVPKSSVILNLGSDPRPGKVYGVDFTNLYRGKTVVEGPGTELNWFYKPSKEIKANVNRAFRIVYKRLKAFGLEFLLDNDFTVWEILPYTKEKYAGMYKHPSKAEVPGRLIIRPEKMDPSDYPYVILHELGHRLHLRYVQLPKLNAQWVRLYITSIKVSDISKETSAQLLDMLISGEVPPSGFGKTLEEDEDKRALRWLLRYISSARSLSVKDLDCLHRAEAYEELRSIWPDQDIPKKELAPIVSEYATMNVRELFAEAFALHLTKKKLPKAVVKLLEKSISVGKQEHGSSPE